MTSSYRKARNWAPPKPPKRHIYNGLSDNSLPYVRSGRRFVKKIIWRSLREYDCRLLEVDWNRNPLRIILGGDFSDIPFTEVDITAKNYGYSGIELIERPEDS